MHDKDVEYSIIGTVLYEGVRALPYVAGVSPQDFFFGECRAVFGAFLSLSAKKLDINVKSVLSELGKRGQDGVSEEELREMMDYRVSLETVRTFAVQVTELAGMRDLESHLETMIPRVRQRQGDLLDYISQLSHLVVQLNKRGAPSSPIVSGDGIISEYLDMLSKTRSNYSFCGIPEIDERLIDIAPGEITIIAARPGVGKTAIMLQSTLANVYLGHRVGFISMEMSRSKLVNRLVSHLAVEDGTKILKMGAERFSTNEVLKAALQHIADSPIFIDDTGPFDSQSILAKIRRLVYEHSCDIVFLDYIGLISPHGELVRASRNEQLSVISRQIKLISNELGIPIIVASQLNRDVERRLSSRPNLSDLRDSGALEQDASLVAFLYLESEDDNTKDFLKTQRRVPLKVEIAKQRNGPTFVEELYIDRPTGRFELKVKGNATY